MADRLGIVTRYHQHEVTHAAIHLAELARDQGTASSIYGVGAVRRDVARLWDSKVVTPRQQDLADWAQQHNRILWTCVPSKSELLSIQEQGVDTALLVNWEELTQEHRKAFQLFDKVIFPYRCVSHVVSRRWDIKKTTPILMPWDVPIPHTRRDTNEPHKQLCVYFPMYDSQPQRVDQAIFRLMRKVLSEADDTNVLVACGRSWSLSSRRIIKSLRKDFGGRVVLALHPHILHRMLLFARADLTVWAPRFESFGLIGLGSLCMGSPVISWDIRPQNEFLKGWKNSVLVPAKTKENWLGVPEVVGGYNEFSDMLVSTLRDKALIAKMKTNALSGLEQRRQQFEAGWDQLSR